MRKWLSENLPLRPDGPIDAMCLGIVALAAISMAWLLVPAIAIGYGLDRAIWGKRS